MAPQGNPFKTVDLNLPLFVNLRDVSAETIRARLQPSGVHQLDIKTSDTIKAFERLRSACERSQIKLIAELDLLSRHAKKLPTPCLVLLENQTPENVLRLLSALTDDDTLLQSVLLFTPDQEALRRLAEPTGISVTSLIPRPASQGPGGRAGDTPGIALVYHANRRQLPAMDPVRQHLDQRSELLPGSISVVVVLRQGP
jgi:hypothetical protein